jgi:hypothetical protein
MGKITAECASTTPYCVILRNGRVPAYTLGHTDRFTFTDETPHWDSNPGFSVAPPMRIGLTSTRLDKPPSIPTDPEGNAPDENDSIDAECSPAGHDGTNLPDVPHPGIEPGTQNLGGSAGLPARRASDRIAD